ncbi:TetR/AcrR family transcriptional regulator [Pseudomonas sp. KNUC1026]|uniref:TetR/AcrR family transcriptional regulator n=1 Tax=Pseudomonas sp. KNUC1026 TaxID=2893890 RepID=UPI001F1D2380|nr:TetR family transcriptional regulator [Pseudomonas sp. KNUC1026]UFH51725.1 TetR family transcriptional regulator [Pseudomonas sp. KNUC1026]
MVNVASQPGAANVANAVANNVRYQGRKASRQGSEQRRQEILDAAMRIVVRDGVRGVRHRAVAAEAGVPLSATTYYFKDIEDLLADTFARYVERSAEYMAKLWETTEAILLDLIAEGDGSPAAKGRLADEIAQMVTDYVRKQVASRRDYLMAEQAFRQEALLTPRLAGLVVDYQAILLSGACQILRVLGSAQPEQDAQVLSAVIAHMEYQALLEAELPPNEQLPASDPSLATMTRYMHLVMASA